MVQILLLYDAFYYERFLSKSTYYKIFYIQMKIDFFFKLKKGSVAYVVCILCSVLRVYITCNATLEKHAKKIFF